MISQKLYDKMKLLYDNAKAQDGTVAENYEPLKTDDKALMTFLVLGDPQVCSFIPGRQERFQKVILDLKKSEDKLDALILVGDITENGLECEFRMVSELLNEVSDKFDKIYLIPGNHDIRLKIFSRQFERFSEFTESVNNGVVPLDKRYWYSKDYPHCKFIMMGTDRSTFEAAYISKKQLKWLDAELSDAEEKGIPAFVFNHQPFKKTNGLPDSWGGFGNWRGSIGNQNDKVRNIFRKHKNIIFINGHLHYGISNYTYNYFGCFSSVTIPTAGGTNHGELDFDAPGCIFSLYDDRVEVKARIFSEGRFLESKYCNSEFTIPLKK